MSIDGIDCRRRTEDLVDDWAHDAKIVGKDEHVKARAGLESSTHAWEERNRVTPGKVGEAGAHAVVEVVPEITAHAVHHAAAIGGAAGTAAGWVTGGCAALGADMLYIGAWAHPHAEGDQIRALQHNDAVNVAIATKLEFADGFKADERARRPGVEKGTSQLLAQLDGKDKPLVPILQARADQGFIAHKRAFAATASLAGSPERGPAIQKWLKANGFEDRQRNDVAFGKGAEYFDWLQGVGKQRGVDVAAESKKVEDRQAPERAFACRG
jgi:hypothetical protein